jgi:nitrogen fixation/metabolism regulation signal transduction histidine kinase
MPTSPERAVAPGSGRTKTRSRDTSGAQLSLIPVLLRFISCGLLAITFGVIWRFTLAPKVVGISSAFAGIFFLLLGFIIGGLAWYTRDVRVRGRDAERISDERLVFSFVVFAAMPFAVLVVVGLVWLLAFIIGAH